MKERNLVTAIILSLVTCGIYGIIWFIGMTDDAKYVSEDTQMQSGGLAFVLTLVTCGIYGFYWAYKMGKMIEQAQTKRGLVAKDNSILYIVLMIFGLGIVDYALMQNDLNDIIRHDAGGSTQVGAA